MDVIKKTKNKTAKSANLLLDLDYRCADFSNNPTTFKVSHIFKLKRTACVFFFSVLFMCFAPQGHHSFP